MMITAKSDPVAWALLIDSELGDAADHLNGLIAQMVSDGQIDEVDFSIQLGHVFAHLNRAWNARNDPQAMTDPTNERREEISSFPTDLEPNG